MKTEHEDNLSQEQLKKLGLLEQKIERAAQKLNLSMRNHAAPNLTRRAIAPVKTTPAR